MPTQNIPNGWKKVKLGEVVDLMQGFAVNKKTNHYISDKGLPLLKISDLINNTETLFVREDIPQKFIVNENDIIFSRTGQVGLVFTGKKGVIYNNCFKVIPKGIDKNYLYYWLKSSYVKYMANTLATGSAQPDLNHDAFKSIEIIIPENIGIQKKISSILSAYDDLIENNNKRIKNLEAMARVKSEEILKKSEERGKLEEKSILEENEYFEFIRENVKKFEGEKIYYATADIDGINIVGKGEKVNYKDKPSRAQKQPVKNSVWFARMIDTYKVLVFSNVNEHIANNILLSSGMVGFKAKDDLYLPFLFWTINNKNFHKLKDSYCTGATQRALTNDGLKMIKIKFPSKEDIIEFGKFAKPILDLILNFQLQNQNLKQTRDLLIPRLVSGKLDVVEMEVI